ncbi:MAG: hypothetical protein WAW10_11225 [Gallionella sp.]
MRQQKNHAGQNPGTGFFIATHHPESQAWSLRVLSGRLPPEAAGCAKWLAVGFREPQGADGKRGR